MEKIYTATLLTLEIQPKQESINKIKAFASSYRMKETDQQIIFEGFLN
jgi:patatin-like phospholipase/acyl hydrolase